MAGSGEGKTGFLEASNSKSIFSMFLIVWCLASTAVIIYYVVLPRILRKKKEGTTDTQKSNEEEARAEQEKIKNSKWINEIALWIFNNYKHTSELATSWLKSLNDCAKQELRVRCSNVYHLYGRKIIYYNLYYYNTRVLLNHS